MTREGVQLIDTTGTCLDCGKPSTGLRCRKCHGLFEKQRALTETAAEDRRILARLAEGARRQTIALELGVSNVQIGTRIKDARRREELRQSTGGIYNSAAVA